MSWNAVRRSNPLWNKGLSIKYELDILHKSGEHENDKYWFHLVHMYLKNKCIPVLIIQQIFKWPSNIKHGHQRSDDDPCNGRPITGSKTKIIKNSLRASVIAKHLWDFDLPVRTRVIRATAVVWDNHRTSMLITSNKIRLQNSEIWGIFRDLKIY